MGRGQRMCWKKSLGEGNEVQADGSCLSFLPVRVRMPRATQGSDPALSWGAAPFPRDPNIPQGAKPGKKKSLVAGCACQTQLRPFLGCWERLSSASRVDPQEFTPPNPLWMPNGPAPPALAGLGCLPGQLWPHRLPAHLDFPCLPLDLRPWMLEQLPAGWSSAGEGTAGTRKGRGSSRTPGHSGAAAPEGAGTPWRSRPRGAAPQLSRCSEIPSGIPFSPAPKRS